MTENTKGRLLLTEKDFREVVDDEGNALASAPKHWGEDQLAPGASFKESTRKAPAKQPAAKKTAAKKAAASGTESGGESGSSDSGSGDGSGDSGSSE